jgi:hypothetical protein
MTALSFLGLAIADALNPFSIAAMVYLLATDRAVARGLVFVLGTLAIYIPFGILLVEGWTAVLASLLPLMPVWLIAGLLIAAGVVGIAIALWMITRAISSSATMPLSDKLTLKATALFAMGSTLADAPTAFPFFAAAGQVHLLADARVGQYALVLVYCLIYVAPLLLLLGLRVWLGDRSLAALDRVKSAVDWSFRHLLPPLLVLIGAWLIWLGAERLLGAA